MRRAPLVPQAHCHCSIVTCVALGGVRVVPCRETGAKFAVKMVRIPQLKKKDLEGLKEEVRVMQRVRDVAAGAVHC